MISQVLGHEKARLTSARQKAWRKGTTNLREIFQCRLFVMQPIISRAQRSFSWDTHDYGFGRGVAR